MLNAVKGEAPLVLSDGREFTVIMDFDAFVAAEGAYGKPLAQLTVDVASGFIGALRAMLYGTLQAKHPEIDLSTAGTFIASDAAAVEAAIELAATRAYPDAQEDKKPGKAPARRGKTSGASGANAGSTRKPSGAKPRARSR